MTDKKCEFTKYEITDIFVDHIVMESFDENIFYGIAEPK